MDPQNPNPTETILGTMRERDELLRQEALNGRTGRVALRIARWARTIARVAFVLSAVGILAAIVVGPEEAIGWLVTDLVPVVVLLGVMVGVFGLLVRQGGQVYDEHDKRHSTNPRERARGKARGTPSPAAKDGAGRVRRAVLHTEGGFSDTAYWLLVGLFLLAGAAMACFFWLVVRDQWINHEALVAGRFDDGESLRVLFALLVAAASSGLLWGHYRKADSYGSPLGPFFAAAFALCAALAAVTVLPAVFAG